MPERTLLIKSWIPSKDTTRKRNKIWPSKDRIRCVNAIKQANSTNKEVIYKIKETKKIYILEKITEQISDIDVQRRYDKHSFLYAMDFILTVSMRERIICTILCKENRYRGLSGFFFWEQKI